jgi:hypothetical protein
MLIVRCIDSLTLILFGRKRAIVDILEVLNDTPKLQGTRAREVKLKIVRMYVYVRGGRI